MPDMYKIVEYKKTNEFFIYNLLSQRAFHIGNEDDRKMLREKYSNIYVAVDFPPLERVSFIVTSDCNMNCMHCYFFNPSKKIYFPVSYANKILKEMYDMGVLTVGITGGEPTLHKNIIDFVSLALINKVSPTFATNGLLLNPQLFLDLYNSGLRCFSISLDSVTDSIFRQFRKCNGIKNILSNIAAITKLSEFDDENIIFNYVTVVNDINIDDLDNILNFIISLSKPYIWVLSYPNFIGNASTNKELLKVDNHKLRLKIKALKNNTVNTKGRIILHGNLSKIFSPQNQKKCCGPQGEFTRFLVINADGQIDPCTNAKDKTIGSIFNNHLKDIWLSKKMRQYKDIPDKLYESFVKEDLEIKGICDNEKIKKIALRYFNDLEFIGPILVKQ